MTRPSSEEYKGVGGNERGVRVDCSQCGAENPEVAAYCCRCGQGLRGTDDSGRARADAYVVQSAESVTQFALLSTVMPRAGRRSVDSYRWALIFAALPILVLAAIGLVPAAIVAAAVVVPAVYLLYLYDVNLWEDTPLAAVVALFVVTGTLAAVVSLVFFRWVFDGVFASLTTGTAGPAGSVSISPEPLLVFAVLLPVVALLVMNVGPLWLASRPRFDEMIDGFTLGVAAGTAYGAVETVVAFLPVFSSGAGPVHGGMSWLPVIINLMVVKSLVYGTAAGIAVATYSGLGEGYDGFQRKYFANLGFAAAMLVAYWLGVRLLVYLPSGQFLGLLWGLAVLAVLAVRARVLLHTALLEAAVQDAAAGRRSSSAAPSESCCPSCEMPLLEGAMFCVVCGGSVRAASRAARRGAPPEESR